MAPLSKTAAPAIRSLTRHTLPKNLARPSAVAACVSAPSVQQKRGYADENLIGRPADAKAYIRALNQRSTYQTYDPMAQFDTPYHRSGGTMRDTTDFPDFSKYKSSNDELTNKVFSYFMVGTMGAITAFGAKATIQNFLVNMSASLDVLAQAKVEVDLNDIPVGKNVVIKWRGKPVFIRHRTESEIKEAQDEDWEKLRDPQPDKDRVKKPEWLIMLGVCTHLGCVPIGEAGDYGGWFCPCHGSHYDISGRVRKGPAPLNLEVPEYSFPEEGALMIG